MIRDHRLVVKTGMRNHWCAVCWRVVRHRAILRLAHPDTGVGEYVVRASFWYHIGSPMPQLGQADARFA